VKTALSHQFRTFEITFVSKRNKMMPLRCVQGFLLLLLRACPSCSFQHLTALKSSYSDNNFGEGSNDAGRPTFPSSYNPQQPPLQPPTPSQDESAPQQQEQEGQANTRFSVFAPDPNLEASDFRSQLRENMKADLERRRNEDPNRGNQIAKNYLDSL
jgi:hypothetical protein